MTSSHAGNSNTGSLNRQDLIDAIIFKNPVKTRHQFDLKVQHPTGGSKKQSTFNTLPGRTCPCCRIRCSKSFICEFAPFTSRCSSMTPLWQISPYFASFLQKTIGLFCQYGRLITICN